MNTNRVLLETVLAALAITACRRGPVATGAKPAPAAGTALAVPKAHDPALAPVECPLAKQGSLPSRLRPFDDMENYIAFLERADRATWQRPDAVVEALALRGDETVADVGAGSGYFTFRLARALPRGSVHAIDVEPEMVRHIHHKAMSQGVSNVHVALGKADDPGVPREASVVLVCDVLHHIVDRRTWLARLASEMASEARLALIEFKEGPLPEGPPAAAKIAKSALVSEVTRAGLVLVRDDPDLLPYQTFLVFEKP